jgi:hypothetical protein
MAAPTAMATIATVTTIAAIAAMTAIAAVTTVVPGGGFTSGEEHGGQNDAVHDIFSLNNDAVLALGRVRRTKLVFRIMPGSSNRQSARYAETLPVTLPVR